MLPLHSHIWVGASAGTGKTTTLTNRVLQLLLHGIPPSTILCLTYTNAAAAEMKLRIMKRLGEWVVLEDAELRDEIMRLTGRHTDDMLQCARALFFNITENPDSLNIQTIHGFCQSILRRFPIEAGVSPYFSVIDEEKSNSLISQAYESLMLEVQQGKQPALQAVIQSLMFSISDYSFRETVQQAIKDSHRWRQWLSQPGGLEMCNHTLRELLELSPSQVKGDADCAPLTATERENLSQIATHFQQGKAALKRIADEIETLLASPPTPAAMDIYAASWLTQKYELLKAVADEIEQGTAMAGLVNIEASRAIAHVQTQAHLEKYHTTSQLYAVVDQLWQRYAEICHKHAFLDYHDLLHKTQQFLGHDEYALGWVMYKLDGGVDHILVDEAQDTNPLQWEIIKALTVEYFSGEGRKENMRTIFVVGDEKQSIFGFQDADLARYHSIKRWLEDSAAKAKQPFQEVHLNTSYRSTPEVIGLVNRTVSQLGFNAPHVAHRSDAGNVEIWPLASKQEEGGKFQSPQAALAQHIAQQISEWLASGRKLANGNAIQPGDIMILVRRRSEFSLKLASELRTRGIAVQGVEHLVLQENLAVQDILALIQWILLPSDDYKLACILRSPIGGISEQELFDLAHDRGEQTLWARLQAHEQHAKLVARLTRYKRGAAEHGVHSFLHMLLYKHGLATAFAQRMGQDVGIALQALLEKALQFEANQPNNYQLFAEFLHQQNQRVAVKGEASNSVRIMTVHGSKGLEAPLVILADTTGGTTSLSGFDWLDVGETRIPCWLPSKGLRKPQIHQAITATQHKSTAEDKRLLYVALTRARDELVITGYEQRSTSADSWYELLRAVG